MASKLFPTRALALLLAIGFIDLVATAVMHQNGMIIELNPIMRPLIERSEWLFAFVKGMTLVTAWVALVWYAQHNRDFVRKACVMGSAAYMTIWTAWFLVGHFTA